MFKRIGLFLLTNILIMTTISIVLNVLGVNHYLTAAGINYGQLMVYCLVWGFGGAFISLALSKFMAKMMMGVKIIDPNISHDTQTQWLLQTTYRLANGAGLTKKPEVGIYESDDINAFATGPSKNNSLVAVSSGLLRKMNQAEVEGVLAHEIAHVANGDMVTMTLVQGIVNAFGMFLARVIGFFLSQAVDEEKQHIVRMISTIVLDILFSILGLFVVSYYSRQREFRADKGAAQITGKEKMIAALQRLRTEYESGLPVAVEKSPVATLQISNRKSGFMKLLSTHPSLEDRIERLRAGI